MQDDPESGRDVPPPPTPVGVPAGGAGGQLTRPDMDETESGDLDRPPEPGNDTNP